VCGGDRKEHLGVLDGEDANLRAALEWAARQDSGHAAVELCAALGWYWRMRARHAERLRPSTARCWRQTTTAIRRCASVCG
jgi:hypothetical protein